jgi:GT2 family glycosyltransferase
MKLSIVIVNYNVEYFLEQCLLSVEKAKAGLDIEVFVVDNNSVDGSVNMVRQRFPWVILLENSENVGFSRANNQAMLISSGDYILLLNPDTVIEEDTLLKCLAFMEKHPDTGGLGVRMIDGKGGFLPESKRGLPNPATAFYKISGISALFRKSPRFNYYHLGHLDPSKIWEIDILSGAFMMMRKKALDKVGLLDEAFFMYGEDIDLSWRLKKAGYKNYYFPETTIIHYKGESTKKGSLNYVFVFYRAMLIFARKHFSTGNARIFSALINLAIYLRASLAIAVRFFRQTAAPMLDIAGIFALLWVTKELYQRTTGIIYNDSLVALALLSYALIWASSAWLSGAYDRPYKVANILRAAVLGMVLILLGYSMLPEEWRFSRAIILLGLPGATAVFFIVRTSLSFLFSAWFAFAGNKERRYAIVGERDEVERVNTLLAQTGRLIGIAIPVSPDKMDSRDYFVGNLAQLSEIVRVHKIDEVVFCARDISAGNIMSSMGTLGNSGTDFKIAPPETLYLIGSNSVDSSGDLFVMDVNGVNRLENKRARRLLDILISLAAMLISPVLIWVQKRPSGLIRNIVNVLAGRMTWVGYAPGGSSMRLPRLPQSVLNPAQVLPESVVNQETIDRINVVYAKDYSPWRDLALLMSSIRQLGSREEPVTN